MYSGDELQVASGLVVASTKPLLQPIYRLHVELLEMIFNIYVEWLIQVCANTRRFILCTHVCHTWRAVALSSARLWRFIDFTQPKVAMEFLVRSKQVPIYITIASNRNFRTEPFCIGSGRILRQHAERIREINVFLGHDEMRKFLTHFDFALPSLSALSLQAYQDKGDLIFTCAMPNVRVVNLSGVVLPWDACTNLTSLMIYQLSEACTPSVSQILTIMTQCPALEFVHLTAIHPVIGAATILQTPIELRHLHTIELSFIADHIVLHILSCISIPSFATICIFNPISSPASVIPRDTQHLHNFSYEGSILCLRFSGLELCRSRPVERGSQIILSVENNQISNTNLSSLVETLDLLSVVTLRMDGWNMEYIMDAFPHSFLAALTSITTLQVNSAESGFFESLIQAQETLPPTLHNDIIFPELKTLIIQLTSRATELIGWLKQRNELGVRLRRLELIDCEVSQDMDELKLLVDEMIEVRIWC